MPSGLLLGWESPSLIYVCHQGCESRNLPVENLHKFAPRLRCKAGAGSRTTGRPRAGMICGAAVTRAVIPAGGGPRLAVEEYDAHHLFGFYVVAEYRLVPPNIARRHLLTGTTVKRQTLNTQPEIYPHNIPTTPTQHPPEQLPENPS